MHSRVSRSWGSQDAENQSSGKQYCLGCKTGILPLNLLTPFLGPEHPASRTSDALKGHAGGSCVTGEPAETSGENEIKD